MTRTKLPIVFGLALLVVGLPFVVIHLAASPDDAPITPLQHAVAALANFFGPWGVVVVRLVDFPNAGLRSFSLPIASGMTLLGTALVAMSFAVRVRTLQVVLTVAWLVFLVFWFGMGLVQIANGLL